MAGLLQSIRGALFTHGDEALLLLGEPVETTNLYLAFSLIVQGTESEFFPESLLDDWGHEITNLSLYEWIQKNGIHFPRAELFGSEWDGSSTQYFLRDLDLMANYPCYGFNNRDQPISDGIRVVAIGLVDSSVEQAQRINRPRQLDLPLRKAKVHWWRIAQECSRETILNVIADSSLQQH